MIKTTYGMIPIIGNKNSSIVICETCWHIKTGIAIV